VGEPTQGIPGATDVVDGELRLTPGRPLSDMNKSPRPDFDDFFIEKDRLERATGRVFNIEWLPFESSRGCWWGEHKHCLFCGINDDLMRFREKDTDRVISELVWLLSRYKLLKLCAADWIISRRKRREIFTRLKELDLDLECFYETRADLTKEEILLMQQAGVTTIQPGIESFSTELLMLMNKNTSRIRHVQFLRWCKEYESISRTTSSLGSPASRSSGTTTWRRSCRTSSICSRRCGTCTSSRCIASARSSRRRSSSPWTGTSSVRTMPPTSHQVSLTR